MTAGNAVCVLVADDHEDSLTALARLLGLSGYVVRTARSIAEASSLAAQEACDLLVADIEFPDGSGLDLMRDLSARYALKGIAVSGYATPEDVRAALAAGFSRHVAKPVTFDELLEAVRDLAREDVPTVAS